MSNGFKKLLGATTMGIDLDPISGWGLRHVAGVSLPKTFLNIIPWNQGGQQPNIPRGNGQADALTNDPNVGQQVAPQRTQMYMPTPQKPVTYPPVKIGQRAGALAAQSPERSPATSIGALVGTQDSLSRYQPPPLGYRRGGALSVGRGR